MSLAPPLEESPRSPAVPRRRTMWLVWLEGFVERVFILFALYTLSIGPLYWNWVNARHAHGWVLLAAFFEPLRILGEVFPWFGNWLNAYIAWWVG